LKIRKPKGETRMKITLNKRIKWYSSVNYLELFDPKIDKIISIEFEDIEYIWDALIAKEYDLQTVLSLYRSNRNANFINQLISFLKENKYTDEVSNA